VTGDGPASGPVPASADHLLAALRTHRVSARELADWHLHRAAETRETVNSVVWWDEERARAEAASADARIGRGDEAPLLGLPVTFKESIALRGSPMTLGERSFIGRRCTMDSPLVARARRAGAVVLGKTNLAHLLSDWQTVNPVYGRTNNPLAADRTAGGSSGGAAAVAAGVTPLDIGTDMIGSVRMPAAFCGVVAHRPSDALLPRSGQASGLGDPVPMGVYGPIAHRPEDLRVAVSALAGPELQAPRARRLADFRVAILPRPAWLPMAASVVEALEALEMRLRATGALVAVTQARGFSDLTGLAEVALALVASGMAPGLSCAQRRVLAAGARRRGERFDEVFARAMEAPAHERRRAVAARRRFRAALDELFKSYDVLVAPITLTPAFRHLAATSVWPSPLRPAPHLDVDGAAVFYGFQLVLPAVASVPGHGATALPVATTGEGLPIGVQVIGPYLEDLTPIEFAVLLSRRLGVTVQ